MRIIYSTDYLVSTDQDGYGGIRSQITSFWHEANRLSPDFPFHHFNSRLIDLIPIIPEFVMINLSLWTETLNTLDDVLDRMLNLFDERMILVPKQSNQSQMEPLDEETMERLFSDVCITLNWLLSLLRVAVNKDVFNSSEILVSFLGAFDDRVAFTAFNVIEALCSTPPSRDIIMYDFLTPFQDEKFPYIFQLVDCVISVLQTIKNKGLTWNWLIEKPPYLHTDCRKDINHRLVGARTYVITNEVIDLNSLSLSEVIQLIPNHLEKFCVLWRARIIKLLNKGNDCQCYMLLFKGLKSLVTSLDNDDLSSLLNGYDFIVDDMLNVLYRYDERFPSQSIFYNHSYEEMQVLILNLIGDIYVCNVSADENDAFQKSYMVFAPFQRLSYRLGLTVDSEKSFNHYSLLNILDSLVNEIDSILNLETEVESFKMVASSSTISYSKFIWNLKLIEAIVDLLSKSDAYSDASKLIFRHDSIMSALRRILKITSKQNALLDTYRKEQMFTIVQSQLISLLHMAVSTRDIGGSITEELLLRLQFECDLIKSDELAYHEALQLPVISEQRYHHSHARGTPWVNLSTKGVIYSLLMFIKCRICSGRAQENTILEGYLFENTFNALFNIVSGTSPVILDEMLSILRKALARDQNTPVLLNHFIQNGIIKNAWSSCISPTVVMRVELLLDMVNLVSEIAVTDAGLELVKSFNPFNEILKIFHDEMYLQTDGFLLVLLPYEKLADKLSELCRYYPDLLPLAMQSFKDEMSTIMNIAQSNVPLQGVEEYNRGIVIQFFVSFFLEFFDLFVSYSSKAAELLANQLTITFICDFSYLAFGDQIPFLVNLACIRDEEESERIGFNPVCRSVFSIIRSIEKQFSSRKAYEATAHNIFRFLSKRFLLAVQKFVGTDDSITETTMENESKTLRDGWEVTFREKLASMDVSTDFLIMKDGKSNYPKDSVYEAYANLIRDIVAFAIDIRYLDIQTHLNNDEVADLVAVVVKLQAMIGDRAYQNTSFLSLRYHLMFIERGHQAAIHKIDSNHDTLDKIPVRKVSVTETVVATDVKYHWEPLNVIGSMDDYDLRVRYEIAECCGYINTLHQKGNPQFIVIFIHERESKSNDLNSSSPIIDSRDGNVQVGLSIFRAGDAALSHLSNYFLWSKTDVKTYRRVSTSVLSSQQGATSREMLFRNLSLLDIFAACLTESNSCFFQKIHYNDIGELITSNLMQKQSLFRLETAEFIIDLIYNMRDILDLKCHRAADELQLVTDDDRNGDLLIYNYRFTAAISAMTSVINCLNTSLDSNFGSRFDIELFSDWKSLCVTLRDLIHDLVVNLCKKIDLNKEMQNPVVLLHMNNFALQSSRFVETTRRVKNESQLLDEELEESFEWNRKPAENIATEAIINLVYNFIESREFSKWWRYDVLGKKYFDVDDNSYAKIVHFVDFVRLIIINGGENAALLTLALNFSKVPYQLFSCIVLGNRIKLKTNACSEKLKLVSTQMNNSFEVFDDCLSRSVSLTNLLKVFNTSIAVSCLHLASGCTILPHHKPILSSKYFQLIISNLINYLSDLVSLWRVFERGIEFESTSMDIFSDSVIQSLIFLNDMFVFMDHDMTRCTADAHYSSSSEFLKDCNDVCETLCRLLGQSLGINVDENDLKPTNFTQLNDFFQRFHVEYLSLVHKISEMNLFDNHLLKKYDVKVVCLKGILAMSRKGFSKQLNDMHVISTYLDLMFSSSIIHTNKSDNDDERDSDGYLNELLPDIGTHIIANIIHSFANNSGDKSFDNHLVNQAKYVIFLNSFNCEKLPKSSVGTFFEKNFRAFLSKIRHGSPSSLLQLINDPNFGAFCGHDIPCLAPESNWETNLIGLLNDFSDPFKPFLIKDAESTYLYLHYAAKFAYNINLCPSIVQNNSPDVKMFLLSINELIIQKYTKLNVDLSSACEIGTNDDAKATRLTIIENIGRLLTFCNGLVHSLAPPFRDVLIFAWTNYDVGRDVIEDSDSSSPCLIQRLFRDIILRKCSIRSDGRLNKRVDNKYKYFGSNLCNRVKSFIKGLLSFEGSMRKQLATYILNVMKREIDEFGNVAKNIQMELSTGHALNENMLVYAWMLVERIKNIQNVLKSQKLFPTGVRVMKYYYDDSYNDYVVMISMLPFGEALANFLDSLDELYFVLRDYSGPTEMSSTFRTLFVNETFAVEAFMTLLKDKSHEILKVISDEGSLICLKAIAQYDRFRNDSVGKSKLDSIMPLEAADFFRRTFSFGDFFFLKFVELDHSLRKVFSQTAKSKRSIASESLSSTTPKPSTGLGRLFTEAAQSTNESTASESHEKEKNPNVEEQNQTVLFQELKFANMTSSGSNDSDRIPDTSVHIVDEGKATDSTNITYNHSKSQANQKEFDRVRKENTDNFMKSEENDPEVESEEGEWKSVNDSDDSNDSGDDDDDDEEWESVEEEDVPEQKKPTFTTPSMMKHSNIGSFKADISRSQSDSANDKDLFSKDHEDVIDEEDGSSDILEEDEENDADEEEDDNDNHEEEEEDDDDDEEEGNNYSRMIRSRRRSVQSNYGNYRYRSNSFTSSDDDLNDDNDYESDEVTNEETSESTDESNASSYSRDSHDPFRSVDEDQSMNDSDNYNDIEESWIDYQKYAVSSNNNHVCSLLERYMFDEAYSHDNDRDYEKLASDSQSSSDIHRILSPLGSLFDSHSIRRAHDCLHTHRLSKGPFEFNLTTRLTSFLGLHLIITEYDPAISFVEKSDYFEKLRNYLLNKSSSTNQPHSQLLDAASTSNNESSIVGMKRQSGNDNQFQIAQENFDSNSKSFNHILYDIVGPFAKHSTILSLRLLYSTLMSVHTNCSLDVFVKNPWNALLSTLPKGYLYTDRSTYKEYIFRSILYLALEDKVGMSRCLLFITAFFQESFSNSISFSFNKYNWPKYDSSREQVIFYRLICFKIFLDMEISYTYNSPVIGQATSPLRLVIIKNNKTNAISKKNSCLSYSSMEDRSIADTIFDLLSDYYRSNDSSICLSEKEKISLSILTYRCLKFINSLDLGDDENILSHQSITLLINIYYKISSHESSTLIPNRKILRLLMKILSDLCSFNSLRTLILEQLKIKLAFELNNLEQTLHEFRSVSLLTTNDKISEDSYRSLVVNRLISSTSSLATAVDFVMKIIVSVSNRKRNKDGEASQFSILKTFHSILNHVSWKMLIDVLNYRAFSTHGSDFQLKALKAIFYVSMIGVFVRMDFRLEFGNSLLKSLGLSIDQNHHKDSEVNDISDDEDEMKEKNLSTSVNRDLIRNVSFENDVRDITKQSSNLKMNHTPYCVNDALDGISSDVGNWTSPQLSFDNDQMQESASNKRAKLSDHFASSMQELSSSSPFNGSDASLAREFSTPGYRFRAKNIFEELDYFIEDCIPLNPLIMHLSSLYVLYREIINSYIKKQPHSLDKHFLCVLIMPELRKLLDFDSKRLFLRHWIDRLKNWSKRKQDQGNDDDDDEYSNHGDRNEIVIDDRSKILETSRDEFSTFTTSKLLAYDMEVTFGDEEGVDAGGLTNEWYSIVCREMLKPSSGLFLPSANGLSFQPNPSGESDANQLDYFIFIGKFVGKAIVDGNLIDCHFTASFYKHILGIPVSFYDLEAYDETYYKSLMSLMSQSIDELNLDLTFSVEKIDPTKTSSPSSEGFETDNTVDLIPHGRMIKVTDDNKVEYVRLLAHHRLSSSFRRQIDAFLDGFHSVIPSSLISFFDSSELELLICGLPEIDLDDLYAHTVYHGYRSTDLTIQYFWKTLRSCNTEEKALFLQFVTGTSKVPLDGFKALRGSDGIEMFNIHKAYDTNLLPTSHTCFNQLDLPEYTTEEEMKRKLLIAIRAGYEGFGFA